MRIRAVQPLPHTVRSQVAPLENALQVAAADLRDHATLDSTLNQFVQRRRSASLRLSWLARQRKQLQALRGANAPGSPGPRHLVQALGYQAIRQGCLVLYRSVFDVVRDFLHDEAFAGHDKVLAKYLKPELLIIDDMGMKQLPKRSGEYLFEIIMRRYETRSTVMTSNRPLEDWGKLLGDVPSSTAILDRFLHHVEIITMNGRSYRLRNQQGQPPPKEEKTPREKEPNLPKEEEKPTKESKPSRRTAENLTS